MNEEERKIIKQIAKRDTRLARLTEDILESMPPQAKTPGAKYNFDDKVWDKVNARRTSRGEAEI